MKKIKELLVISALLFLVACGTTSGLQEQHGETGKTNENAETEKANEKSKVDLSQYENIVVLDFADKTKNKIYQHLHL